MLTRGIMRLFHQRDAEVWTQVAIGAKPGRKCWSRPAEPLTASNCQKHAQHIAPSLHVQFVTLGDSRAQDTHLRIQLMRFGEILLAYFFTAVSFPFPFLQLDSLLAAVGMWNSYPFVFHMPMVLYMSGPFHLKK